MVEQRAVISPFDEDSPRRKARLWPIMAALIIAEITSTFEGSMIYAALKSFYQMFDNPVAVGWLVTGYMLVASTSAAIFGRLGDLFGRKRIMLVVLGCSIAGSLLSASTSNLYWIIAGRALQGSAGAILPLCYGIVRENCPAATVPVNIGIIAATVAGGTGIGLILGGALIDYGNWRLIFVASAVVAATAFVAVSLVVPSRRGGGAPNGIDWIGGTLFVPALVLALYALGASSDEGWGSLGVWLPFAIGIALLGAWARYEYRHPNPLIDVRLIAEPQVARTLAIWSLLGLGAMNLPQIVMVMLQQPVETGVGLGVSATLSGVLHSPAALLGVAAGPVAGFLAARRGAKYATIVATGFIALAWIGLWAAHGSVLLVGFWIVLNGIGMGAAYASVPNLIVEVAPHDRTSEATGLAQIVRKVASGIGAQLIAVSLATSTVAGAAGGKFPDGGAFFLTYGWVAGASFLALLVSLTLPDRAKFAESRQPVTGSA